MGLWYTAGMSKPEDSGRCINCGFLAKHPSGRNAGLVPTPSYYEIEHHERDVGEVWTNFGFYRADGRIETTAACFRSAANLPEEIATGWSTPGGQDIGKNGVAIEVFERERECESWYRYQAGLSPKEHYDQLMMEQLERSRRDFEERLERDRKQFDLKLFEISQGIQKDSRKIARRSFWFNLLFTLVIVVLTLLQILIALHSRFPQARNLSDWLRRFFLPWM